MSSPDHTRKDFEDAFWRLYAEKPVEKISVRELTELAGYNRGTFYLHYQDIYDLFSRAKQDLLDQMGECVAFCSENMGKIELIELMMRLLALYERNRTQIVLLLGERGDAAFTRSLTDMMKQIPIWRVANPELDIPAGERELLLEQTVSGVLFLIGAWLDNPRGVSATRLLHLIYDSAIK